VVQDAARATALALLAAAFLLAGCGGGSSGSGEHAPRVGGAQGIAPVSLVDCADWKRATPTERTDTVIAIRKFAGGPVGSPSGGRGATLPDEDAYKLFDTTCSNGYARAFKLYKLYTRAAAFTPQK
jgi:hypothetical protein